jgi:hypothetical protein
MVHLDIDSEEQQDLKEFLKHCVDSLKIEVAHTDHRAFRTILEKKERVLQKVLEKLQQGE